MENNKPQKNNSYIDLAVLIGTIVYFVTPVDLLPDITPIGFMDDTAILTIAFDSAKSLFSSSDIAKANQKAAKLLGDNFDSEKAAKMVKMIMDAKK